MPDGPRERKRGHERIEWPGRGRARRASFLEPLLILLLLILAGTVTAPWLMRFGPRRVTLILSELPDFMVFREWGGATLDWGLAPRLVFAIGWTTSEPHEPAASR